MTLLLIRYNARWRHFRAFFFFFAALFIRHQGICRRASARGQTVRNAACSKGHALRSRHHGRGKGGSKFHPSCGGFERPLFEEVIIRRSGVCVRSVNLSSIDALRILVSSYYCCLQQRQQQQQKQILCTSYDLRLLLFLALRLNMCCILFLTRRASRNTFP